MKEKIITRKDVEETLKTRDLVLSDYAIQEKVLDCVFSQYPRNTDYNVVLLKVTLLNQFYSTGIRDVKSVARHIVTCKIDAELAKGKPDVVHKIALVKHGKNQTLINHFSFATKYCSFHQPNFYPIYDDYVYSVLSKLKSELKCGQFSQEKFKDKGWKKENKECGYNHFHKVYDAFIAFYHNAFEGLNYKQVDKYIWGSRKIASLKKGDDHIDKKNRNVYETIVKNNINTIVSK
ncbi:MAG: hypothetical protein IKS33_06790 [Bacteroidales bacterium]|nr:hypothetical protein [Bacteroidales bacterium]